jgi:4-amino-4-deoxy-L-arabinose transferase-like glycosyltransferase
MIRDQHTTFPSRAALAIVAALALRLVILATDSVPFNSDEAVVALMARHTLQGQWPIFFYGQSYMGSLDATLIAAAFALLGQSVLVIRLVQSVLFLGIVVTSYLLGIRILDDRWKAGTAALLVALPTVLVSTYTTATLGGYGEILLLGNLLLLLGHAVATDRTHDWRVWAGLGATAGLGFWTSALIGVYLLPAGVVIITRLWRGRRSRRNPGDAHSRMWGGALLAVICFALFSGPWWWRNFTHGWSAMRFLLTGTEQSGIGIGTVPLGVRLTGMLLLGLPALLGMRFPWAASYLLLPLAIPILVVFLAALSFALTQLRRHRDAGRALLAGMMIAFAALFLLSRFGTDATGRYFLPLVVPLALWTADLLGQIRSSRPWVAVLALAYLLGFNLIGHGLAISQSPPGLTTQFDPSNRFDNRHDEELISFLRQIGSTRGYSNYFVSFRIAFLSHETVVLSSQLPYKPDLSYNPADDRFPPYTEEVERADQVVYITTIHPALDTILSRELAAANVQFAEKQIGPYHIFYELSRRISPQELGFGHP